MKKILLSAIGLSFSFLLAAQQPDIEDLKTRILKNESETSQLDDFKQLTRHYMETNSIEELESFAKEIEAFNSKAYAKFNWDLMNYYLGKDKEKYQHYADITKETHPDKAYISDALQFNEIAMRIAELGYLISGDDIATADKEALHNLAQSPTFYGNVACEYYFRYFDSKPCANIEVKETTEANKTATSSQVVEAVEATHDFKVYPNPSETGIFNLEFEGFVSTKQLEVFNTVGAKVWSSSTDESILQIELPQLKNGIYFLRVNDGTNSKTQRILIQ